MFGNAEFNMALHVAELRLGDEIDGVADGAVDEHALTGGDYELLRVGGVQRDRFADSPGAGRFAPTREVLAVEQHLGLVSGKTRSLRQAKKDCGEQGLAKLDVRCAGSCSHI